MRKHDSREERAKGKEEISEGGFREIRGPTLAAEAKSGNCLRSRNFTGKGTGRKRTKSRSVKKQKGSSAVSGYRNNF